ncbi:RHS repeat protein [Hahella sp. KA22]|uniref:RHS repeat protein n=1 Tax=Hahella sp. KA22 TaxID=1628392 RepID=UPI0013E2ADC1|nr:RHS repeat protein [Hahella sp. KA22]
MDDRFVTELFDLDSANFWRTKTETTNGKTRTTRYTYKHQTWSSSQPQLIGLLTEEKVEGDNGENWVTSVVYDTKGQLTSRTANGVTESFTYHNTGELATKSYTNHNGPQTVSYNNYFRGVAGSELYPDGSSITRSVNPTGTIAWEDDAEGHRTSYSYDALNRVTRIDPPGLAASNYQYEPNKITVTRDGSGYRKEITLDGLGRAVLSKESGAGIEPVYVRTEYDAGGRETFVSYASANSGEPLGVVKTYDALNRVTSVKNNADNSTATYCYGVPCVNYLSGYSFDDAYTVTNARGHKTAYLQQGYGSRDNLQNRYIVADIAGAARQVTSINRNKIGDITSVTQDGVTRTYVYQPGTRRMSSVMEPERGKVVFSYDAAGNTRSKQVGAEGLITFTYDAMNRLTNIGYPAGNGGMAATPSVAYDYDRNGRVTSMAKGASTRGYAYTPWGALDRETLKVNDVTFNLDYAYNQQGQLYQLTYPNNTTLTYSLDDWGRPTQVGQFISNIRYYPTGQMSGYTYGNGQQVSYALNARKFVERIKSVGARTTAMDLSYTFDGNANVTSITDNVNSLNSITALGYDGLDRLTSANGRWGAGSFSYDAKGNLLSKNLGNLGAMTYHYDGNNRLANTTGANAFSFSYDAYGNVRNNGRFNMTYNHANEMTNIKNGEVNIDYLYDGDGIRVLEVHDDKAIYQMHDKAGDLLYEQDFISNKESVYVRFNSQTIAKMDTCLLKDTDNDGITDCQEQQLGFDVFTPTDAYADDDGDGVSNLAEVKAGTSPRNADTDNDGIPDGWELRFGLNPLANDAGADIDGDGFNNLQEYQNDTDPKDPLNVPLAAKLVPVFYLLMD